MQTIKKRRAQFIMQRVPFTNFCDEATFKAICNEEAGHAVAAAYFDFAIELVTGPTKDTWRPGKVKAPGLENQNPINVLACALCGPLYKAMASGGDVESIELDSAGDVSIARQATRFCLNDAARESYRSAARDLARKILREHSAAAAQIARELFDKGQLTGDDVCRIFNATSEGA